MTGSKDTSSTGPIREGLGDPLFDPKEDGKVEYVTLVPLSGIQLTTIVVSSLFMAFPEIESTHVSDLIH